MSEVFLDGEEVTFDGPPPASVSAVWTLVEGFLGGSGKVIRSMEVDGVEWTPESGSEIETYRKIAVHSWTQLENLIFSVEQIVLQGPELQSVWKQASREILSTGWKSYQNTAIAHLDRLQPWVQVSEILLGLAEAQSLPWEQDARRLQTALNACLGALIDTFEPRDSVRFSDLAARDLQEILDGAHGLFAKQVLPSLKGLAENE